MQLNYVLYASNLVENMGHRALNELLDVSQRNNSTMDISGFLHIENQIVLQYLEGPSNLLQHAVDRIREDPRHAEFSILSHGPTERRFFEGWNMALVESTTLSLFDLMGRQCERIVDVAKANPFDLISLLSANASLLRHRPSLA